MANKYDIDADDAFYQNTSGKSYDDDDDAQSEDILDEIIGKSSREPKRPKEKQPDPVNDEDLYSRSSDREKEPKRKSSPSPSRSAHSKRYRSPSPERSHKKQSSHTYSNSTSHSSHRSYSPSSSRSPHRSQTKGRSYAEPSSRRDTQDDARSYQSYQDNSTVALIVSRLHWWTTDKDVKAPLIEADMESEIKELSFSEHKHNGKSKGECFLEFTSADAAKAAKKILDDHQFDGQTPETRFCKGGNPYKNARKEQPTRNKSSSSHSTSYMPRQMPYQMYNPMQMMPSYPGMMPSYPMMMGRGGAANNMGGRNMYMNPGYWPNSS